MNHHAYAAALFSSRERDIAWLSLLALGEVSVVVETKMPKQPYCCYTVQGSELDGTSRQVVLTIASLRTLIMAGLFL